MMKKSQVISHGAVYDRDMKRAKTVILKEDYSVRYYLILCEKLGFDWDVSDLWKLHVHLGHIANNVGKKYSFLLTITYTKKTQFLPRSF